MSGLCSPVRRRTPLWTLILLILLIFLAANPCSTRSYASRQGDQQ